MALLGLQDKVAVVTGGAAGIGAAVCGRLVAEGCRVVVVDRDGARAEQVASDLGSAALAVAADVASEDGVGRAWEAAVDRFGGVDCLHANAGVLGPMAPLADLGVADFDGVMAVNLRGVFLSLRAFLAHRRAQRGQGAAVITASVDSFRGARRGGGLYITSKHAVLGLMRTAALEGAPLGIRVNAICPGMVDTQLLRDARTRFDADPDAAAAVVPMQRLGQPDEIAAAVAWLLSAEAPYVTGAALVADGALTA